METQKIIAGIVAGGTLVMGGVDASVLNETAIQRVEAVAQERVEAKQVGNVVETTLPWKGENGLKVKYDMGEPTASEKIKDKRDKQVITERVDFADDGGLKIDIILDKKPDTNVFCYTIEGAENYNFFYQKKLTAQEIIDGSSAPDWAEGSYAVYHKTLRDHVVGKTNYKTGKVMHIPRPQVWEVNDKENTTIWADLSYNEGQLCVTVDNNYLQKAKYPVRVDPTFGYTSLGALTSVKDDDIRGSQGTTAGAGTVNSISVYVSSGWGSGEKQRMGLYDISGNYIAQTEEKTGAGASATWHVFNFVSPPSVSASTQYLTGMFQDTAITYLYDDTSGLTSPVLNAGNGTYPTWPNPVGLATVYQFSIYATYTESGGGGGGGGTSVQESDFWFE